MINATIADIGHDIAERTKCGQYQEDHQDLGVVLIGLCQQGTSHNQITDGLNQVDTKAEHRHGTLLHLLQDTRHKRDNTNGKYQADNAGKRDDVSASQGNTVEINVRRIDGIHHQEQSSIGACCQKQRLVMYNDMQLILPGKPLRFRQAVVVILLPDAHTAARPPIISQTATMAAMVSQPFASVAAPLTMGITRMETTMALPVPNS